MRPFEQLLEEAVAFHGHLCPGQVLGVRMAVAGCRVLEIDEPRSFGKGLVVFVEIDRCATDAIQVVTGVSLGKRTLKFRLTDVLVSDRRPIRQRGASDGRSPGASPGRRHPRVFRL